MVRTGSGAKSLQFYTTLFDAASYQNAAETGLHSPPFQIKKSFNGGILVKNEHSSLT